MSDTSPDPTPLTLDEVESLRGTLSHEMTDRLLTTITTLKASLDDAEALLTTSSDRLEEASRREAVLQGQLAAVVDKLRSLLWVPFANSGMTAAEATKAADDRIAALLEASVPATRTLGRTPGTVEVCALCKSDNLKIAGNCPGWYDGKAQDHQACPVKAVTRPAAAGEGA